MNNAVFIVFVSSLSIGSLLSIIAIIIYEVQKTQIKRKELAAPNSRKLRKKPLVSLVVNVNNGKENLDLCVQSIVKSSYRKYEVVLLGTGSKKNKAVAEELKNKYPKKVFRTISGNKIPNWKSAASKCKGELVIILNSDYMVKKTSIAEAVKLFTLNTNLQAINGSRWILPELSIRNLLQRINTFMNDYRQKCSSVFGVGKTDFRFVILRREALVKKTKGAVRIKYANNVAAYSASGNTKQSRFALLNYLACFMFFWVNTYFIYVAIAHRYPNLFALAWAFGLIGLTFIITLQDNMKFSQKLGMVLISPLLYLLIYLESFARFLVLPKSVRKHIGV
jgi:glycosyltransferase involved in cell wall biosynthesis